MANTSRSLTMHSTLKLNHFHANTVANDSREGAFWLESPKGLLWDIFQITYQSFHSDVLFRHRRKCSLHAQGALENPVEAGAIGEQHTSLRAKPRDNIRPRPDPPTSDDPDPENPNNALDDINAQFFVLSADGRNNGVATSENQASYGSFVSGSTSDSANIVTPDPLLESGIVPYQTSYIDPSYIDQLSPLYNYEAAQPSINATNGFNSSGLWNEVEASVATTQEWDGGVAIPPHCNPFVIEPKMSLIENNIYREQCGPQRVEPTNAF